jgi:hypothetical protein
MDMTLNAGRVGDAEVMIMPPPPRSVFVQPIIDWRDEMHRRGFSQRATNVRITQQIAEIEIDYDLHRSSGVSK